MIRRNPLLIALKYLSFLLIALFLISTPVLAGISHEAFTIISPAENGEYTVNTPLSISATADKFIVEYANGFRVSNMNYVILEVSKDNEVKKLLYFGSVQSPVWDTMA